MPPLTPLGKSLIVVGIVLIVAGVLVSLGGSLGLGRLPGDIHVKRGNFQFYFPIVTCVVVSLLLSLILGLFRR